MTDRYPLTWPQNFPRTKFPEKSRFTASLSAALKNVISSLSLFGKDSGKAVSNVVLSSNVSLGNEQPMDAGVAVWFVWDGLQVCIPVDRYKTPAENLQAIHHVIEARRTELRHGTLALVRATMTGFTALPSPRAPRKPTWRETMGFYEGEPVQRAKLDKVFRELANIRHPDKGGDAESMARLNAAREEALKEIG